LEFGHNNSKFFRFAVLKKKQTPIIQNTMHKNPLHIAGVESRLSPKTPVLSRGARRSEIEAAMERSWLQDPEQFNPERDAVQKKRVASTLKTIKTHLQLGGIRCTDLGCGNGKIAGLLRDEGAQVDALDIASKALDLLKAGDISGITLIQDCLPATRLEDSAYDLVVCTETIAYLEPKEYRLLLAELSRLIKKDGMAVCSTPLDIYSENALEHFAALAETEFEIDEWVLRYDLLWIKCCQFFEAPGLFIKAANEHFRKKELEKRKSLNRLWFKWNTTKPLILFWRLVNPVSGRIASALRQSNRMVDFLEKTTKFFWDTSGISHALFIGKRRPLAFPLPPNEIPVERRGKREVWD
jgi:2-polyprenyl-3-methyl-5-hydroxy-6-metoxy-1,4-benzoquinol methylase